VGRGRRCHRLPNRRAVHGRRPGHPDSRRPAGGHRIPDRGPARRCAWRRSSRVRCVRALGAGAGNPEGAWVQRGGSVNPVTPITRSHLLRSALRPVGFVLAGSLVLMLLIPLVALATSASWADLEAGTANPMFAPALWLSLRTTLLSLGVILLTGTPLAWWFATSESRWARVCELIVALPIVIPPAVVGVALLQTFGRNGILGPLLA